MASGGFKIADGYVEIGARDSAGKVIDKVIRNVESIDDRVIGITATDKASGTADQVTGKLDQVKDKDVKITGDDQASDDITKVDSKKVADKVVQIKADDKASGAIDKASNKKPEPVIVPVEAEDKTDAQMGAIGGKLKGWAAGLGLGSIIGGALLEGLRQTNITAQFQNQMGSTEAVAKSAGTVAGRVFAEGFTKDQQLIRTAISSLSSDVKNWGDITDAEQQRITSGAVKIAQTWGGDVNAVIAASSSMVTNKLAPSYRDAFDLITRGMQSAGSRGDDLLETIQEYSGYFQQLGLDGAESLGLITQMLQAGARDTDYAADAIKEFGIRAVETGGTASEAFTALGLDANKMAQEFGAGGNRARDAFIEVVKVLQSVKDPVDQNRLGVQLFGTQWEDTMKRILPNLDLAKLKIEDVAGATDRLKSEMSATDRVEQAWGTLTSKIAEGLVGLAQGARDLLQLDEGASTIERFTNIASTRIAKASQEFDAFGQMGRDLNYVIHETGVEAGFATGKTDLLSAAVSGLTETVMGAVNNDLAFRQSIQATKDAQEALVATLKKHKPTSDEAIAASFALESAQIRQAEAARASGASNSKAGDDAGKLADGNAAAAKEIVNMASAANGNGTPALRGLIGHLTDAELRANGATRTIDAAGNAVIRLPPGKEIKVDAKDVATPVIRGITDKQYNITIDVRAAGLDYIRNFMRAAGIPTGFAEGGLIVGPGTGTSDDIPIMASNGEYMIKAKQYRKYPDLVRAINEDRLPAFAGGGPIGGGSGAGQASSAPAAGDTFVNHWHLPQEIDLASLSARVARQIEIQRRNRR